jgi:hypothetical protein
MVIYLSFSFFLSIGHIPHGSGWYAFAAFLMLASEPHDMRACTMLGLAAVWVGFRRRFWHIAYGYGVPGRVIAWSSIWMV